MWSYEDESFVATCAEFPSLSWLAEEQWPAIEGLEALIVEVIRDMTKSGEEVPVPISERAYSGKFNLRVGPSLHRQLSLEAAQEQLSLNQYVVRRLS
ncbi:MAG: type II toxin-antitoxin system HicB family antitoxin [Actinobacteria bacterium]|nr:type II toxin-antitoxin system HicB family antitoxin [Actinomycetota bacterium]